MRPLCLLQLIQQVLENSEERSGPGGSGLVTSRMKSKKKSNLEQIDAQDSQDDVQTGECNNKVVVMDVSRCTEESVARQRSVVCVCVRLWASLCGQL